MREYVWGWRGQGLTVPYQRFAIRLAVGILGVLYLAHSVEALRMTAHVKDNGWYVIGGLGVEIGLLLVQAVHCVTVCRSVPSRGWQPALLGQVVLTYLPFLFLSYAWLGMPSFLAGWCLLLLPPIWCWVGYTAVVVAQALVAIALQLPPGWVFSTVVWTATTGLGIYCVVRLAALARDVAGIEVARERERYERDLHDLIGQRLLVIALKSELAHRLLGADRDGAGEQLSAVIDVVRQAQSDVHAVAHGRATTSLETELASARTVLESAGASCELDVSCGELTDRVNEVLVAAVRECVTNVLRHSAAEACWISVRERAGRVELTATNDGVVNRPGADPGVGLRNLRDRAEAAGGQFTAGKVGPGRFRLVVRLPLERR